MDIEGCGGVGCDDCIRMTKSPFQPEAEEMPLDPAIGMLRVFEEIQFVNFEDGLAG